MRNSKNLTFETLERKSLLTGDLSPPVLEPEPVGQIGAPWDPNGGAELDDFHIEDPTPAPIDAEELNQWKQEWRPWKIQQRWGIEEPPKAEINPPKTALPSDIQIPPPQPSPGEHIEPTDPAPSDPYQGLA